MRIQLYVLAYSSSYLMTNYGVAKTINDLCIKKYWLGTDKFGRDILSRLIIGTKSEF